MKRLLIVGIGIAVAGLALVGAGFLYAMPQAEDGLASAEAMYQAQGVELSYNEAGQLTDRGTTEGADAILALLQDEWKYPLDKGNLDPDDPIVNTRDELMVQYAVITYHVLHGEVDVVLTAEQVPITYRGVEYTEPGTYKIAPLAYFAQLDRTHPIEGQLRGAWSPLAIALTGSLAGGHANQAAGELAQATSLAIGGMGFVVFLAGAGLVWASFERPAPAKAPDARMRLKVSPPEPARGPAAEPRFVPRRSVMRRVQGDRVELSAWPEPSSSGQRR